MLTIAIVEDHQALRESLVDVLAAEGHAVSAFDSAEAFHAGCTLDTLDILVLDLNLPGEDGIAVAGRIRSSHPEVGIVMLTARGEPDQRRIGYESGADIYLTKPSSVPELTSSVEALTRRLKKGRPDPARLVLDCAAMTLAGPSGSVALSAAEVEVLAQFARAPNNRLETARIDSMLGGGTSKAAIEVRIVRLRKKMLMAGAARQPINVVRNFGYQTTVGIDVV